MKSIKMVIANNKKANYEYYIQDKYEAGIVLKGTEIKAIREGKANINDAYISIEGTDVCVNNMHISAYSNGNIFNHDEKRVKKILLNKHEILKLKQAVEEKGMTIVPLSLYIKDGLAKLEIALAKGKKTYDKRESIKRKDIERAISRGTY